MPWNLLVFPLLGGYYFLSRCYYFKWKYERLERQRLIFNSTILGAFFLFVGWGLAVLIKISSFLPSIQYLDVSIFSFLVAILLTHVINLFKSKDQASIEAVMKYGNYLEKLIVASSINMTLLQITLMNGKVYIGIPLNSPDLNNFSYIELFPLYSGYRDDKTKELNIISDYYEAYASYMNDNETDDIEIRTLIRFDQIITATPFDQEIYHKFDASGRK